MFIDAIFEKVRYRNKDCDTWGIISEMRVFPILNHRDVYSVEMWSLYLFLFTYIHVE